MVSSFAPISSPDARVLVLGTMPGVESLRTERYYANPRNQFWSLMAWVPDIASAPDYDQRCAALRRAKIALWDVLCHCDREGSLDSAIQNAQPNDFATFFAKHPSITRVYFNGTKARSLFQKLVAPERELAYVTLPSTSPANTSRSKQAAWRAIES